MRKFIITVNGKSYEAEVEELMGETGGAVSAPSVQVAPAVSAYLFRLHPPPGAAATCRSKGS